MDMNKPVAYACQIVEADFETNILKIEMLDEDYKVSAGIKYLSDTHPIKELTDEEIEEFKQAASYYGIECSSLTGIQEFAKAILKKAQEK